MSATNSTANYNLPLFIGSDKPAWLTDWNGAMNAIDSAIASVSSAQSGTATDLSALTVTVSGLSSTVSDHTTSINTLSTAVSGNTGAINTINSLIGNGEPTTTDKTLIGAINELYNDIHGSGPSVITAGNVSYDNTTSGLTADDVQEAIDELAQASAVAVEVQSGTLTAGQTSITLTFASQTIGSTSRITVFDDLDVDYQTRSTTSTTVTLTFEAQASDMVVSVEVAN